MFFPRYCPCHCPQKFFVVVKLFSYLRITLLQMSILMKSILRVYFSGHLWLKWVTVKYMTAVVLTDNCHSIQVSTISVSLSLVTLTSPCKSADANFRAVTLTDTCHFKPLWQLIVWHMSLWQILTTVTVSLTAVTVKFLFGQQ